MSRHFASTPQPWFKLGRFDIGTSELVSLAAVGSMGLWAVSPAVVGLLALTPALTLRGFVWQLITWPLSNAPSIFAVWSLVVFWWVGRELERDTGRNGWAAFLAVLTVALSVLMVLLALATGMTDLTLLAGVGGLTRLVLLTYIAEHPNRPFFFNIPAWVVGAVIVAIDLLLMIGSRQWILIVHLALSLLVTALIARSVGLLTAYDKVPFIRMPARQHRPKAQSSAGNVRYGPWNNTSSVPQHETDELDALLDKIAAGGLGSLTDRERRRLDDLRKRRRGD